MADDWSDFDLKIVRGETAFLDFVAKTEGVVQDISGWSIYVTWKRKLADADAAAVSAKSTADDVSITDGPAGKGTARYDPEDTLALPNVRETFYVGVRGEDALDRVHALARGKVTLLPAERGALP